MYLMMRLAMIELGRRITDFPEAQRGLTFKLYVHFLRASNFDQPGNMSSSNNGAIIKAIIPKVATEADVERGKCFWEKRVRITFRHS